MFEDANFLDKSAVIALILLISPSHIDLQFMSFRRLNDLVGWLVFAIAATTYLLTMEPTASFWDCGEFIAVSYKLEVPHPPGAPFFLLVGRMFSFLALGDTQQVAFWITSISAFSSAFTILFLFWSITLLARRWMPEPETLADRVSILGAGAVGALAYTFSDSFWFSAVEAEVYGMSSFFTALVVWAMLKWERIEDERKAHRFLIFITYMMGLSIGVHLLNLLTIPALALIYYYRRYENRDLIGQLKAIALGFGVVGIINFGIIPGLPSLAGSFEIFFINNIGLPFGSGLLIFVGLFVGAIVYALLFSMNTNPKLFNLIRFNAEQKSLLNLSLLSLVFILIGYSSYLLIIIRSNNNPPINENDPSDIISFVSYLKREQYGYRPLGYGPHFMAERPSSKQGAPKYRRNDALGKYEIYDYKTEYEYTSADQILFPRVYSQQGNHPQLYREKLGMAPDEKPTMAHNIAFMLSHQFGHMYFRYFMWNFAGRASDNKEADWLLPWEGNGELPELIARDRAHDNFYLLPLILGILGILLHLRKDKEGFSFVLTLFLMLGAAIVLYINSPPMEPRERDYVYVGSFYAFAIWIGLGVLFLKELLEKVGGGLPAAALATLLSLAVPALMGTKSWDNHDRSGRYFSVDQARNTLASCAPNAILFTGGDNDTFPLWYVQEVEGFRTDVRVVVLSYFNTDWYVSQMQRKVNESDPLPITFTYEQYREGFNDIAQYYPPERGAEDRVVDLQRYIAAVQQNNPQVVIPYQGSNVTIYPSKKLELKVDSAQVAGIVPEAMRNRIENVQVTIEGNYILKGDLMILDILANNNWERPIYFNTTSANTTSINLRDYLFQEGMAFRLLPVRSQSRTGMGGVNVDVMLENLKGFQFRGMQDPDKFYDVEFRRFASNFRSIYWRLAAELMQQGRKEEAVQVLEEALAQLPDAGVPYSYYAPRYVDLFLMLEQDERGIGIADTLARRSGEVLDYLRQNGYENDFNYQEIQSEVTYILNDLLMTFRRLDQLADGRLQALEARQKAGLGSDAEAQEAEKLKARQIVFKERFASYDSLWQRFR